MAKILDKVVKKIRENLPQGLFSVVHTEKAPSVGIRGDVFVTIEEEGRVLEEHEFRNLITRDLSILVARLCKDNAEPLHGIYMLAVGTGDVGWDVLNPPAPTNTQRSLYNEIERKAFTSTQFIDSLGNPSAVPTNIVDFVTVFSESEAVGPLVEMGLIGGDVNMNTAVKTPILPANGVFDETENVVNKDQLCNYFTFPVINKPASATLRLTWRLTF